MARRPSIAAHTGGDDHRRELNKKGWTKVPPSEVLSGFEGVGSASKRLAKLFTNVPPDPYCANGTKRRRFLQYTVHPKERLLTVVRPIFDKKKRAHFSYYFQDAGVNPEDGGEARGFHSIRPHYYNNELLHHLIWKCFDMTKWRNTGRPKIAGLHVVAYVPTATTPSVASPNLFHQDGEPYTFCILFERKNISGGENYIGPTSAANKRFHEVQASHILDRFTLHEPFETYGVYDPKISHYVSPHKRADTKKRAVRNVLLLDFTEIQ